MSLNLNLSRNFLHCWRFFQQCSFGFHAISSLFLIISFCGHFSLSLADNIASSSSFSIFRIPDQQAFIGKLFYYQIDIPENVENFTLMQAGYTASNDPKLPDWLYFDQKTGFLFGVPNEKRIYFIQVEAILDNHKYEDIFVIETIERPTYLINSATNLVGGSSDKWDSGTGQSHYQCRIDLKRNFLNVQQIYETIVIGVYRSYFLKSDQTYQQEQTLRQWLRQFQVQTLFDGGDHFDPDGTNKINKEYHIYYDVQDCETNNDGQLQLDHNSQLLLRQLNLLNVENELIKITHVSDNNDINIDNTNHEQHIDASMTLMPSSSTDHHQKSHHHHNHHHHHHHHHKRRDHHRRNAYVDDENAYETPTLNKEMWSSVVTTSTIDYSMNHLDNHLTVLSRTAIPSMISPTFIGQPSNIQPTPTFPSFSPSMGEFSTRSGHQLNAFPSYPQLYGTPVLVPELSKISRSISIVENIDQRLFTPVFSTHSASMLESSSPPWFTAQPDIEPTKSTDFSAQSSITVVENDYEKNIPVDESKNVTTTTTTTSTTSTSEPSTTILNHRPFVNKRISKLSITAGKFWQFSIPEDTFYDKEDGNTRQLKIGFFMDSELLPANYWIQFDNENQYLYALPTDDDIGRHRFNLVAVDLQGGEATEIVEIYVRQSRQSLSYTHKFILANITWDDDRYPERIQAVSSILQRMTIHVFEEMPSGGLNEAAQRQALLRHINVLSINQNPDSLQWSITWTNDSLRRHPCPVNEINLIFNKLYDITYPEDNFGFMSPSLQLREALSPDFTIERVKRTFIGRSACGSHAAAADTSASRHKDKIVFSNRINRIGPYRLGSAFKFLIPKDTVYSMLRQVDTRQLALSLAPLEPEIDLPDFIYFDTHEQTIYGLPFKPEHVRTYELKLIAEDTVHGGNDQDIFVLDVEHDVNTREDYLFEVTMSFLYRNIELTSRSQQRLTSKDFYQVANSISTRLMGNSNLEAFRMLDISRHRFTKIAEHVEHYDNMVENYEVQSNSLQDEQNKPPSKRHTSGHHHYHHYHHNFHHAHHGTLTRSLRAVSNLQSDYFYEFVWTNRTLVTSYSHSQNVMGGGSLFETKTCPKDVIHRDIYQKIFPRSANEFLSSVNLDKNITSIDVMDIYNQLFDPLEANLDFLSVEWVAKSVCSNNPVLENRVLGAKPIRDTSIEEPDDEEESSNLDNSVAAPETEDPSINIPVEEPMEPVEVDEYPSDMMFLGDRLLAMLIPPIAILIALLFAVTIGCCFHRANQRRKATSSMQSYHEDSPTLYRQRIPIQLEFERGGLRGSGAGVLHPGEQESMLDSKFGRHPVQVMPPKRGGSNLPAAIGHHSGSHRHANLPYQMLPQQ